MSALRLRRLHVRSMPGFPHGQGFTLDDLDHDVVVLLGPNGSGKTSTARAIQAVLWPDGKEARSAYVEADFTLDDAIRSVVLEPGWASWNDGHTACEAPNAGDGHRSAHYRLALHDMVAEQGEDLARALVRELAGGYDVRAAAGTSWTSVRRPVAKARALSEADQALKEARAREAGVRAREREKEALQRTAADLDAELKEEPALQAALRYRQAKRELREARREWRAFPAFFDTLSPDEVGTLETLERRIADAERQEAEAWEATRTCSPFGRPGALAVPPPGPVREVLERWASEAERLESDLRQAQRECEAADRAVREIGRQLERELGTALDPARLASLADEPHRALVERLRSVIAAQATRDALMEVQRLLDAAPTDPGPLQRGRDRLVEWLAQPAPSPTSTPPPTRPLIVAAATAALLGLVLTGLGTLAPGMALVGLAAGVTVALVILRPRDVAETEDRRPAIAAEFARTGLAAPDWSDPLAVRRRLDEVIDALAEAAQAGKGRDFFASLQPRLTALEETLAAAEAERRRLAETGGVPKPADAASLARVLAILDDLTRSLATRAAAEAAARSSANERTGRLASIAEAIEPYGYPPPPDAVTAEQSAKSIRQWAELTERLRRLSEDRAALEAERDARLGRFGATDVHAVRDLVARLPRYRECRDRRGAARAALQSAGRADDAIRRYASESEPALEERLASLSSLRERCDEIRHEIMNIDHEIKVAKGGTEIETALAERLRAEAALAQERDAQAEAAVAEALTEYVDRLSRERDMPLVFERAREVFRDVTKGQYDLRFDHASGFRAWDRLRSVELGLDALSSGTRVQLLLSVRLAFVQLREAVALPLLLDETLATSDPERSAEVVRAVGDLLSDGRQAFYFTTQPDEAKQWEDGLSGRVRVVRLDEVRRLTIRPELWTPASIEPWLEAPPPAPEDDDYEAYRERLGVPPRLAGTAIGTVHLWHLFDDTESLYRALRFGRPEWGRFETIVDRVLDPAEAAEVRARARALSAALAAFRIGRPSSPVTIETLRASGISPHAMTTIAEHCAAEMATPNLLHTRLLRNEPKIPNVQEKMRRQLADYLESQDLVDLRPPLSPAQIADEAVQAVLAEVQAGIVALEDVHRLVGALPFECEPAPVGL